MLSSLADQEVRLHYELPVCESSSLREHADQEVDAKLRSHLSEVLHLLPVREVRRGSEGLLLQEAHQGRKAGLLQFGIWLRL